MATIIASDEPGDSGMDGVQERFRGQATIRRWKVLESDRPSPIYNGIVCMISASDRVIAVVTEDEQPFYPDDWQAAAHLIASAPELLAALKAMLAHYGPPASVADLCEYDGDHPIALSRDAIARAESQT